MMNCCSSEGNVFDVLWLRNCVSLVCVLVVPLIVHCNGLSCVCVLAASTVALAVLVFFRMSFSSSNSCSALSLLSMCFCSTNRPILVVLFSAFSSPIIAL